MRPKKKDAEDIRIYGLTGGIASGKSLAARFFQELGVPVVDADKLARELASPGGAAEPAILKRFGTTSRAELRKLVFSDSQARRDLEKILHPLIRAESEKRFKEIASHAFPPPRLLIYEAALLVESGRYQDFDGLILITAPENLRLARLEKRDGLSTDAAKRVFSAQASDKEKSSVADFVIVNDGTLEELRLKIQDLLKQLYKASTTS